MKFPGLERESLPAAGRTDLSGIIRLPLLVPCRRKLIEEEEKRLWRVVESRALDAAAAARVEFRRRRDSELLEVARQVGWTAGQSVFV